MRTMIAYVESPGQLVCAVEYIRRTGIKTMILARTTSNTFANAQLMNSLKTLDVAPADYVTSNRLIVLVACFYFYLLTRRCSKLVIGDSRSLVAVFFANHFGKGSSVLVDDGIATITHALRARGTGRQFGIGLTGNRLKNVALRWLSDVSRYMCVFSTIDRDYLHLDTMLNDFRGLVGAYPITYEAEHLCIIGSSVVEAGIITEEEYRNVLVAFLTMNAQAKVTYVPHRLEKLEKLSGLPRVSVRPADLPVELHFLRIGNVPSIFATFYSGAGLGLSRLFPGSTVLVKEIPADLVSAAHRMNYLNIMEMYRHHEVVSDTGIRIC